MTHHTSKVVANLGNDISTDIIYPGRFMATVLPTETPQYAFADSVELNKKLKNKEIPANSTIVTGTNFGCGSSREHAPVALNIAGIEAVVAESYARIFYRNAIDGGFVSPFETTEQISSQICTGDIVEIDTGSCVLKNLY